MDNPNEKKKKKESIKSGINSRRKKGERLRSLHGSGGNGAVFPSVDPKFEMDPASPAAENAHPASAQAPSKEASKKERSLGSDRGKELNTEGVKEARGISHEQRKRRQTTRDLLKVLFALLCIVLLFAAASLIKTYTTVKTISITGSRLYSEAQILSLSSVSTGKSIFDYKESELLNAISSIPNIHARSVKKAYPSRIDIVVEDVFARAFIPGTNGKHTLISAEGYVLGIVDEPDEGLLEIRGLAGYGFAPGAYIDESMHNIRTTAAIKLIKTIDERGYSDYVKYIDLSGAAYVSIGLTDGYTAVLGAITTAPDCIDIAISAYERFLPLYPTGGTINVFSGSSVVDFTPGTP